MKVLNLYAGIGGNRKLWQDVDVTAVEIVPEIAEIYQDFYPKDKVIVGDAHEYLRQHFREFDFIWSSPPCQTHSVLQMTKYHEGDIVYPNMMLYQEIILLQTFFQGKWVVENVKPYYKPLITPTFSMERHFYWSSDFILDVQHSDINFYAIKNDIPAMEKEYGFDLSKYKKKLGSKLTMTVLRNCVKPKDGLYIFNKINKREE